MTFLELVDPILRLFNLDLFAELNIYSIILKLILAILCGGILGVERAVKHHAAGFRTYIIVCVGSAIAMMVSEFLYQVTSTGDPQRLGAQVISGIGFLGAGTIIVTSRNQIRGLTTAAGLWGCACLGLAIGAGYYTLAILGTLFIEIVLVMLPKFESLLTKNSKYMQIHIEFEKRENLKDFIQIVRNDNFKITSIERNPSYSASGLSVYSIYLVNNKKHKFNHQEYLSKLTELPYVNYVEEIK